MLPHERIKPKQLALLNLAIGQLGLDRDDLKARYEVKSFKELTNRQFDELLQHLKDSGFFYRPRVKKAPDIQAQQETKKVYLAAIRCILEALNKPWSYAEAIGKRMFQRDKLEWLDPEQLHSVQVALLYQERKEAGDPVQRRPDTLQRRRTRRGEHDED